MARALRQRYATRHRAPGTLRNLVGGYGMIRPVLWLGTASALAVLFGATQAGAQRPASATAKAKTGAAVPRTPWGHPDLQGVWTNTTTTPLERPNELAGKQVLADEERAQLDAQAEQAADRSPT